MVGVNIKSDIKGATRYLNKVQRKVVPKAVSHALNKTASEIKTISAREIQQQTKLKQAYIKKRISIKRSNRNRLEAVVIGHRGAPNLIEWVNKSQQRVGGISKRSKRYKQGGVSAKAWGKNKVYHGSFVGRGRSSGKLLVLTRKGAGNSVKALYGPSVRRTFLQDRIERVQQREARRRFIKHFKRDMAYYLSRV